MAEGTTYVTTGEVASLEHEIGNHTVEFRVLVSVSLRAGAESKEVLGSLWDNIIVELEVDTAALVCRNISTDLTLHSWK